MGCERIDTNKSGRFVGEEQKGETDADPFPHNSSLRGILTGLPAEIEDFSEMRRTVPQIKALSICRRSGVLFEGTRRAHNGPAVLL